MRPVELAPDLPQISDSDLPSTLQGTFSLKDSKFLLWGAAAVEAAKDCGFDCQRIVERALAVPCADVSGRLVVRPMTVLAIELDITSALPVLVQLGNSPDRGLSRSLLAYVKLARAVYAGSADVAQVEIPLAGYCSINDDGFTNIASASSTRSLFLEYARICSFVSSLCPTVLLRPYQAFGISWMMDRCSLEGGAIVADEMGLGKTLQAIYLLASRSSRGPHLVVCPTSVIGNWRREIERFAPALSVSAHHGSGRMIRKDYTADDIVVTGYSTARTDIEDLCTIQWATVVLDEAQQVKNSSSLVNRAMRRLPADAKVALTGTPVENRLDELWSIMSITNPSILGTRQRFRQRFSIPIEKHRSDISAIRLKSIVEPYLLRRRKVDVASDLPDKFKSDILCTLSEEQVRLYTDEVNKVFTSGLGSGIERKGRILSLLTALKQICNHPAQFLQESEADLRHRSGKLDRLCEMINETSDDDRVLVFTQYTSMGSILARQMSDDLGADVPFFHGGLSLSARDQMVHSFQEMDAPKVMVLSLRAAGFGINLTAANVVVHYDRWWNPAVEDQATDRAHRIGQKRTVSVYSLISDGTLEERIGSLHRSKRSVADVVTADIETDSAEYLRMSDESLYESIQLKRSGY